MTATAAGLDEDFCVPRPTISGTVELVPNAAASQRFLALPASAVSDRTYDPYQAHRHDYDQRVGSLSLAGTAMRRLGAAYPPNGVLAIRQDIQAFQLAGTSAEAIAATFMYRDQLMMSQPDNGAYSLFVMGHEAEQEAEDGYEASYVWYRASDDDPKGAPRFFDHLDWDGDGNEEILLDVFGARSRWFRGSPSEAGPGSAPPRIPAGDPPPRAADASRRTQQAKQLFLLDPGRNRLTHRRLYVRRTPRTEPSGNIAVIDASGRPHVLAAPATRVISLVPSATEDPPGDGRGLRPGPGRTDFDGQEGLAHLPSVGGGLEPSLEEIVALRPTW